MDIERFLIPLYENDGGGGNGGGADGGAAGGNGGGGEGGNAGEGGGGDPWFMNAEIGLDPETQKWVAGKNPPDLKTAIKSWSEADRVARDRNVLERPNPEALTDWTGWEALGWQSDAAKYTLDSETLKPASPDGYDQGLEAALLKAAHENRVPLFAAQAVRDAMVGYQNEALQKLEASGAEANKQLTDALKTEWGSAFDKNNELAVRAAQASGLNEDDLSTLENLMGAPALMAHFFRVGSLMSEDQLAGTNAGTAAGARTPEAAKAERLRLENDAAWMAVFKDSRHPQNEAYTQQRQRLLDIEAGQGRRAA